MRRMNVEASLEWERKNTERNFESLQKRLLWENNDPKRVLKPSPNGRTIRSAFMRAKGWTTVRRVDDNFVYTFNDKFLEKRRKAPQELRKLVRYDPIFRDGVHFIYFFFQKIEHYNDFLKATEFPVRRNQSRFDDIEGRWEPNEIRNYLEWHDFPPELRRENIPTIADAMKCLNDEIFSVLADVKVIHLHRDDFKHILKIELSRDITLAEHTYLNSLHSPWPHFDSFVRLVGPWRSPLYRCFCCGATDHHPKQCPEQETVYIRCKTNCLVDTQFCNNLTHTLGAQKVQIGVPQSGVIKTQASTCTIIYPTKRALTDNSDPFEDFCKSYVKRGGLGFYTYKQIKSLCGHCYSHRSGNECRCNRLESPPNPNTIESIIPEQFFPIQSPDVSILRKLNSSSTGGKKRPGLNAVSNRTGIDVRALAASIKERKSGAKLQQNPNQQQLIPNQKQLGSDQKQIGSNQQTKPDKLREHTEPTITAATTDRKSLLEGTTSTQDPNCITPGSGDHSNLLPEKKSVPNPELGVDNTPSQQQHNNTFEPASFPQNAPVTVHSEDFDLSFKIENPPEIKTLDQIKSDADLGSYCKFHGLEYIKNGMPSDLSERARAAAREQNSYRKHGSYREALFGDVQLYDGLQLTYGRGGTRNAVQWPTAFAEYASTASYKAAPYMQRKKPNFNLLGVNDYPTKDAQGPAHKDTEPESIHGDTLIGAYGPRRIVFTTKRDASEPGYFEHPVVMGTNDLLYIPRSLNHGDTAIYHQKREGLGGQHWTFFLKEVNVTPKNSSMDPSSKVADIPEGDDSDI